MIPVQNMKMTLSYVFVDFNIPGAGRTIWVPCICVVATTVAQGIVERLSSP